MRSRRADGDRRDGDDKPYDGTDDNHRLLSACRSDDVSLDALAGTFAQATVGTVVKHRSLTLTRRCGQHDVQPQA